MANLSIKDGGNADKYLKASGAGSDVDPFVPVHAIAATNYTPTSRNGTTSSTPGNYTELMAANSNRIKWFVQNPIDSGSIMTIAYGGAGSEVPLVTLDAGDSIGENITSGVMTSRLAIRCTVASKAYYSFEV